TPGTKVEAAYKEGIIFERHRHRYEFNNDYRRAMEAAGMVLSGKSADGNLVEIIELKDHPWFVGTQFHPELKSRPTRPHPLYREFIAAAVRRAGLTPAPRSANQARTALAEAPAHGANGHKPEVERSMSGMSGGGVKRS